MHDLLDIGVRTLSVYLFMLIGLRLFGKNQLSQLNAGDVILLLLISNAVQNAMVGPDTSLQGGLFAALILFVANFALKKLMFRKPRFKNLIEDDPVILVKDGLADHIALLKSEITLDELEESIREHGVEKVDDVKLAVLEVDGNISVISFNKDTDTTHYTRHKKISRKVRKG